MSYYLIGHPLGHSCSPELHALLGNPDYHLLDLPESQVEDFIRRKAYDGLNVTIPYKRKVAEWMDVLSDRAQVTGAVNTVVKLPDGRLLGDNTDIDGMLRLANDTGIRMENRHVLILGTGGTAHTAHYVAERMHASSIRHVSRNGALNYENVYGEASDADVLINTTPVGMSPDLDGCPVDLSRFPNLSAVLDVVYNPLRTALANQARSLGIRCVNGLRMLTEQARAAEQLFTGNTIADETAEQAYRSLIRSLTNIVLIGMPGSGKTTMGMRIAELTGRPFYDTDQMVVQESGMEIPEIFVRFGETRFRELEAAAVLEASRHSGAVIAVGGGVPLREDNRRHLLQNGWVCLLERPLEDLDRRGRPLCVSIDALSHMEEVRKPHYLSIANSVVENHGSIEACTTRVLEAYFSHAYPGD